MLNDLVTLFDVDNTLLMADGAAMRPKPDIAVDRIGDLIHFNWNDGKVRL